jgi:hypothetical protein
MVNVDGARVVPNQEPVVLQMIPNGDVLIHSSHAVSEIRCCSRGNVALKEERRANAAVHICSRNDTCNSPNHSQAAIGRTDDLA